LWDGKGGRAASGATHLSEWNKRVVSGAGALSGLLLGVPVDLLEIFLFGEFALVHHCQELAIGLGADASQQVVKGNRRWVGR